mgnify:CR=1 FL=1
MSGSWGDWKSLQSWHWLSGRLGGLSLFVVGLDAVQEVGSALGWLDVLDADVDSLWKNVSADSLVDDDSNSSLGNVEDSSGSSVVGLEWHTLLESSVGLDVDKISALVLGVIGGEMLNSVLAEIASEHITRSASETLGVSHI